jgi:hypothetical protein
MASSVDYLTKPHYVTRRRSSHQDIVDLDFPFTKPSNLRLYGPIVLDSVPVRDLDPQLSDWLDAAPTVLMSMGTHFTYTKTQVRAILRGFLTALDPKTRVLWKLPHCSSFKDIIDELLPETEDKERFMIVDWIPVDPFSIMTHRNVVALRSPRRGKFILRGSVVSRGLPASFLY